MTNTIQKRFKVSSTQLLYQSCPYQAITLFIIGPFLDWLLTNKNVFSFNYTPQVLVSWKPPSISSAPCSSDFLSFLSNYHYKSVHYIILTVLHCAVLPDLRLCKLQYISGYWKDFSSHLPGPRTFENLPSFNLWLCSASWPVQLAQHFGDPGRCNWDGSLFLLLHSWESAEG